MRKRSFLAFGSVMTVCPSPKAIGAGAAFAVLIIGGMLIIPPSGKAQDGNGCSNATLKGDYLFTVSGTTPTGPPSAPVEQFVGLALTHFDGGGGLTQPFGVSHGSISGDSDTATGSGTYSLNADCSGTMTLNLTGKTPAVSIQLWIIVLNRGKEIHTVVRTPTPNGIPFPAANLTSSHGTRVSSSDQ
jgi:hypothetical protein